MTQARTIDLPDGRRLGLAEYGDPDGAPVFLFHGLPGSRLQFHPDPEIARGCGARVLALDRPGIGLSDPQPARRLLDWPDDVAAVADALGYARFGVIGLSGGGPYGAVCAARLASRLTSVTLISPLGPVDREEAPGALRDMAFFPRYGLRLACGAPWLLRYPSYCFLFLRRFPVLIRMLRPNGGISPHDRVVLATEPDLPAMFARDMNEATRQGIAGVLADARVASLPWGFKLESITIPVNLWFGDHDALTPVPMLESIARRIPHCRVHRFPDEGHFLFFHHLREILMEAAESI